MIRYKSYKMAILAVVTVLFLANSGGTPGGYSGSNTDKGATCASGGGCHGNTFSTRTAQKMITSNIPSSGYVPGTQYTISLSATKQNINKFGFEMMAEDSLGKSLGTFSNSADVNIKSGGQRATHKAASNSGSSSRTWDITWTAPAKGTGIVKIYAAVLVANNNGTTAGDNVLIDTLTLVEGVSASVARLQNAEINLYPNPTSSKISISGYLGVADYIAVFDAAGTQVMFGNYATTLDVSQLASGTYYLKIVEGDLSVSRPFIKN